jgi:Copper type II ascorbate-dependent monooxygenase, C-terminal domain
VFSSLASPITLRPGDEIRIDCTYRSVGINSPTKAGFGPQDEMCFGFVAIYPPVDSFTVCSQWSSYEACNNIPDECDTTTLAWLGALVPYLCTLNTCSPACHAVMKGIVNTQCLTGDIEKYLATSSPGIDDLVIIAQNCGFPLGGASSNSPTLISQTSTPKLINEASAPVKLSPLLFALSMFVVVNQFVS